MIISRFSSPLRPAVRSENDELKDELRVLGAVVQELSERVELLETREGLRSAATSP
jgi:hypothetical protein